MCLCLLDALRLLMIVGIQQFLVAGVPDAIEDRSGQAIDGEDLAASISEVNEDKHSKLIITYTCKESAKNEEINIIRSTVCFLSHPARLRSFPTPKKETWRTS